MTFEGKLQRGVRVAILVVSACGSGSSGHQPGPARSGAAGETLAHASAGSGSEPTELRAAAGGSGGTGVASARAGSGGMTTPAQPTAAAGSSGAAGVTSAGSGGARSSQCLPKDPGKDGIPAGPEGQVRACFGSACPHGLCSTNLRTQPPCVGTYPVLPKADFMYCLPRATGAYCLSVPRDEPVPGVVFETTWFVRCEDGVATIQLCPCSCGGTIGEPATCGS